LPVTGPACRFLEQASYVQAICWIGMCLAEALQYAHERDLVHLDIKPSNVLLAADGQPMLLDFHLARPPLPAGAPAPLTLGGTPAYMAPEQKAALESVRQRRALPAVVDGGADVYALGRVLVEALSGADAEPSAVALRARNPHVTPGLAAALMKCIAPESRQRYRTAGDLAADLRRYLAHLPLRGVDNGSVRERWRRWRRRRPYALPSLGLVAAVVIGVFLAIGHATRQTERADAACQQGEQHLRAGRPAEALESFRHGAVLVEDIPFNGELKQRLTNGGRRAERVEAAEQLHQSCEQMRALYGVEGSTAQVQSVERTCARLWQDRERIVHELGELPTAELQSRARADLLDVAILWSDLHVQLTAEDEGRARAEALEVLKQAEVLLGPSCVLSAERRALGETEERETVSAPRHAWEHLALARLYLRTGDTNLAASEIERASVLEPQSLWANFYKGRCDLQSGAPDDAVAAFAVCMALAPRSAWPAYHRGLAYLEQGRLDRARSDFETALHLDPTLAAAIVGRSMVLFRQKRHAEAATDLRRLLEREPSNVPARKLLAQVEQQP
jgi:tetratricopeptide (TPR) repeat protein